MPFKTPETRRAYIKEYRRTHPEYVKKDMEKTKERMKDPVSRAKRTKSQQAYRARNIDRLREYNAQWHRLNRANNPTKVRAMHLKSNYGITPEQFAAKLEEQGGVCGACKTDSPSGRGWMADHDHKTGEFRGVLCMKCNTALGLLGDDPKIIRRAIAYMEGGLEAVRALD